MCNLINFYLQKYVCYLRNSYFENIKIVYNEKKEKKKKNITTVIIIENYEEKPKMYVYIYKCIKLRYPLKMENYA